MTYKECDYTNCPYNGFIGNNDKICLKCMIKVQANLIPECEQRLKTEMIFFNTDNYVDK